MSWYLIHKQGLSLISIDGKEEKFYGTGSVATRDMAILAGSLVININAERPTPKIDGTVPPVPNKPPGTSAAPKPKVIESNSPNFSARGSAIKRIILHYTTAAEVESTLSWFDNPASQVSAHYVVDRDGTIYQCVSDERKAWHAFGENDDSIGIEHVATKGQTLTEAQADASAALIRYLKSQYHLTNDNVTGHRFTPANVGRTDCPGDLWKTEGELKAWLWQRTPDSVVNVPAPAPAKPAILDVPYYSQYAFGGTLGSSICGVTSAAMVLCFWGVKMTPDNVLVAHGKPAGQSPEALAGIFKKRGLDAMWTYDGTMDGIRAQIALGRPVIVHGYFTASGHIMVVTGFIGDDVVCNDPAGVWNQQTGSSYDGRPRAGERVRYSLAAFQKAVSVDGDIWFSAAWKK